MPTIDLKPAADRLADIVAAVPDEALGNSTPCSEYSVGDLLDHINGVTLAFRGAAEKSGEFAGAGPSGTGANLPDDWRSSIPQRLSELAAAWDKPDAWTGQTGVGGQGMPAEAVGVIAYGELTVHAWDLSQGSGIPFDPDPAGIEALFELTSGFLGGPNGDAMRGTAFGPAVDVADDAPTFERVLGVLGRDPSWKV